MDFLTEEEQARVKRAKQTRDRMIYFPLIINGAMWKIDKYLMKSIKKKINSSHYTKHRSDLEMLYAAYQNRKKDIYKAYVTWLYKNIDKDFEY